MARLEAPEQRQNHMMQFLAKAVQNPAFLQDLLNHRQAQRISGPDKGMYHNNSPCCCFAQQGLRRCLNTDGTLPFSSVALDTKKAQKELRTPAARVAETATMTHSFAS